MSHQCLLLTLRNNYELLTIQDFAHLHSAVGPDALSSHTRRMFLDWLVLSRFFREWKSLVPPTLEFDDELESDELEQSDELEHLRFIANEFRDELESDDDEPDELEPQLAQDVANEFLTACIARLREPPVMGSADVLVRALKDYVKHCHAHGLYPDWYPQSPMYLPDVRGNH